MVDSSPFLPLSLPLPFFRTVCNLEDDVELSAILMPRIVRCLGPDLIVAA